MSRYDVMLGKKPKGPKSEKSNLDIETVKGVVARVVKLKSTEEDMFFISIPDAERESLKDVHKELRKFGIKYILTNKFIDVKKVDQNGVRSLDINTTLCNKGKDISDILWSNITGQR